MSKRMLIFNKRLRLQPLAKHQLACLEQLHLADSEVFSFLPMHLRVDEDLSKATLLETLKVSTVRRDRIGK